MRFSEAAAAQSSASEPGETLAAWGKEGRVAGSLGESSIAGLDVTGVVRLQQEDDARIGLRQVQYGRIVDRPG